MLDKVKDLNIVKDDYEESPNKKQKKGTQKTSQKLLDVLHERAFSNKTKTTDMQLQFNVNVSKEEEYNSDTRVKNARKALDFHYNMKKV